MHEAEKSDLAIVAVKPANNFWQPDAEWVEPRAGAEGMWISNARAGRRTGQVCHRRWTAYGKLQRRTGLSNASPSNTRVGSRMRESRTYGSVRGARSNARPYRDLSSDSCGAMHQKSHQIIAGMIVAWVSRSAAAVAARPAFVR
jgi:hypothetical protein